MYRGKAKNLSGGNTMSDTLFVLTVLFLLTVTTWLDGMLLRLHIRKGYFLLGLAICMLLSSFSVFIYDVGISPISFILFALTFILCISRGQYSFFGNLAAQSVMIIFCFALTYLYPEGRVGLFFPFLCLPCALLLHDKPLAALKICTAVPFYIYVASLFADYYFFIGENAPSVPDTLFAQVSGGAIALIVSYAAETIISRGKRRVVQ